MGSSTSGSPTSSAFELLHIGNRPYDETLYTSPAGPIGLLDMIYGFNAETHDNPLMQHRTAFTFRSLEHYLLSAGFEQVVKLMPESYFELRVAAFPKPWEMDRIAGLRGQTDNVIVHSAPASKAPAAPVSVESPA
jgi:hypothetical protein